jgi:sporulation protein YlmC with PRC-barrel domain
MKKLIYLAVISAMSIPVATLAAPETQSDRKDSPRTTQPSGERAGPQAQPRGAQPAQQAAQAIKGSDLIGRDVKNASGKNLGEIQDLVIDINNNRVHYAVLDAQNKYFAYPMRVFQTAPGQDHLVLNVSEDRLEKAPGMDRNAWKQGRGWNTEYQRSADSYWERETRAAPGTAGDVPPRGDQPARSDTRARSDTARTDTGPTVKVEGAPQMNLVLASKLIGKDIEDRQGKNIGEIDDLVIDASSGRVYFAAVDFDSGFMKGGLHPAPLSAFSFREGKVGEKLVLNADKNQLKAERSFDENQLDQKLADRNFLQQTSAYADSLARDQRGAAGRVGADEQKRMKEGAPAQDVPQKSERSPSGQSGQDKSRTQ